jgi:hypothetical protein
LLFETDDPDWRKVRVDDLIRLYDAAITFTKPHFRDTQLAAVFGFDVLVVRVIENAEVVSEMATESGLEVENTIHIELNKQNTVARPRSLDHYFETILVLKRA